MSNELEDFIFFKQNQLHSVDFNTGVIDVKAIKRKESYKHNFTKERICKDAGSKNEDGYIRIWCGNHLRMKHRLIYWLYYNELPEEIDHINRIRDDNRISNLRSVNRTENNKGITYKGRKHFTTEELHNICKDIASKQFTDQALADKYQCSRIGIMGIRHKRRHKDIADLYY